MSTPSLEAIRAARAMFEDKHYIKSINCPEHPGKHQAKLYVQGHQYAGLWECPVTGESDTHEHDDYQIEEVEVDDSHPDRRDGYTYQIYVCGTCSVGIDRDEADPELDRLEALADMDQE
jgi:hypothetical protein